MTPDDVNSIVKTYSERLDRFGVSPRTLGWGDKDRTRLRFEILCSAWNLENKTVLDFGCGFGDLFAYLAETQPGARYVGIDINGRLIEEARRLHQRGDFRAMNILDEPLNEQVDYVLVSGVFNDRIGDNRAFMADAFEAFDRIARCGFAANFLSTKVDYRYPHAYYTDPAEAVDLCYMYSRNVVLRNDYMPFEFTVFVNKASRFDAELAVYEEFLKRL